MSREPVRTRGATALSLALAGGLLGLAACRAPAGEPEPVVPRTPRELARAATDRGDWAAAASHWHTVFLEDQGASPEPIAETARALLHLGEARDAHELLVIGRERFPENVELLELSGHVLASLGHRRAAESCYEEAVYLDPRRMGCLVPLARIRIKLGQERAAFGAIERILEVDPAHCEGNELLARACMASGQYGRAFEAWQACFRAGQPGFNELMTAASLWGFEDVRLQHPDASKLCLEWLEKAAELQPQDTLAHFEIGVISEDVGDLERAVEAYRRAVEVEPTCLYALTNLACLYSRMGEIEGLKEMVRRAVELEPDPERRKKLTDLLKSVPKQPVPEASAPEGGGPDEAQARRR